jgi:hypothetical protein
LAWKRNICFHKYLSISDDLKMVVFSHSSCFPFLLAWNKLFHLSSSCESSYHLPCNLAT